MQVAYAACMKKEEGHPTKGKPKPESPRRARRRLKLKELLREIRQNMPGPAPSSPDDIRGAAALVEEKTGTPRTHIVAIVHGRRGLGDDLAKKLEARFDKPAGWFDRDDLAYWPFSRDLLTLVEKCDPPALKRVEAAIWTAVVPEIAAKVAGQASSGAQDEDAAWEERQDDALFQKTLEHSRGKGKHPAPDIGKREKE